MARLVLLYKRACDSGYAYACNSLGNMYYHGFRRVGGPGFGDLQ